MSDDEADVYGRQEPMEDDFDSDDGQPEIMHPDDPAMQRIQLAFERQLLARKKEVDDELSEQQTKLKQETKRREELGVELYTVQQQLAKLQTQLEATDSEQNDYVSKRAKAEENLKQIQATQEATEKQLKDKEAQAAAAQKELDDLKAQVLLIEKHADEALAQVQGAKLAAKKAGKDQSAIETEKQKQDLYVDRLRERVKDLEREITIKRKQKEAQAEETLAAKDALREAQAEIDEIVMRKKEIQQLWQASVNGLGKRNEALAAMQSAARQEQQELFTKEKEVEGLERTVRETQEKHEQLTGQLARLETELASKKKKLEQLGAQQDEVKREYSIVSKALQQVEDQLARAEQQVNIHQSEFNMARDKADRLARQQVELEDKLVSQMQDKLTTDAAGKGVAKRITKIRAQIADQERVLAEVENSIAQHNLSCGNLESAIEQLEQTKAALEQEEQTIAKDVTAAEKEMKSNYTTIERKQNAIDRMNKRIGELRAKLSGEGGGNEDLSPAQIEVASYRRDINNVIDDINKLQDVWLSRQSELVALERRTEAEQQKLDDARTKHGIFSDKQYRLNADVEARQLEIVQQERLYKQLQNELLKLNTLVTKNRGIQSELQQAQELLQNDFVRQLKEEEKATAQMQSALQMSEEERERLLNAVVEAERQLLLWEKKIQLAKETKAELNSNEGAEELATMRAEIHRMTLRLNQLERKKEEIIVEMERSVDKRGSIGSKARTAAKKGVNTSQTAKKAIVEMEKKVKQAVADSRNAVENINIIQEEEDRIKAEVDSKRQLAEQAKQQRQQTEDRVRAGMLSRQKNLEDILQYQGMVKHFEAAQAGKLRLRCKDAATYEQRIAKQMETLTSLDGAVGYLMNLSEEARQPLQSVRQLIHLRLDKEHAPASSKA
eukprot:TRINITY_DN11110_c0_g2_i4.p1 TRINITY_DN11110_c0_g2~~TRINITY_DN11110_c0_g2_i4.p1  ORF type:complete len:899 (+),score=393.62 TRINITY_DN11110_c0_g2_i4:99-2795(+)